MKILHNYKSTFILLFSIIIGAILGLVIGEDIKVISPLGDLFLNMLLFIVVPLIFLTITTSIYKMNTPKRVGKILFSIIFTFIITSIVALIIGLCSTHSFRLIDSSNGEVIRDTLGDSETTSDDINLLERSVNMISVNDFSKILSKDNMIALIVFSVIFGIAMNLVGDKAEALGRVLDSALDVTLKFINIIMYYAPVGLGAYFAVLVGTFGEVIAIGYIKTFIIYLITSILFMIIVYSLYAFIAGGRYGVSKFWKNIIPALFTALGTCSSAASIPVNLKCTKNIGVSDDIADATISLGTSFHKDGSIIGSVFKIMFLFYLFDSSGGVFKIFFVSLIATLLVTAVPIGGGTLSEMLILTLMDFPLGALPILTIIATIIDAPATVLNVIGDSACSMLNARIVDGKNWIYKKKESIV